MLDEFGMIAQIWSRFTPEVTGFQSSGRAVLASPVRLVIEGKDGSVAPWRGRGVTFTRQAPGAVEWRAEASSGPFDALLSGRMELDGYVDVRLTLRGREDCALNDIRLEVPMLDSVARYVMGMGLKGGLRPQDVMRCFELRVALEGEAASMAAERRSDHDLAEIRQALDELDEAIRTGAVGVQADLRFHHAFAQASRNNLFPATMTTLVNAIFQGMNVARRLSLRADAQRLDVVQAEHRKIFEAIKARNPAAARRAMRTHIDNARRRVLGDQ